MTDLLIGLAVLAGLALFVYAMARAGRQQRRQRGAVFRAFADERGWEYAGERDVGLRPVLEPFEGVGSYWSPSLGETPPQDVVAGTTESGRLWVFWHRRRISEGDALQFYACLLEGPEFGADGLIVRFGEDRAVGSGVDFYYVGQRDRFDIGGRTVRVFEAEPGSARHLLSGEVGRSLAGAVGELPWAVDLQVRGRALALYTIDRNLTISEPSELALLTEAARRVGKIIAEAAPGS